MAILGFKEIEGLETLHDVFRFMSKFNNDHNIKRKVDVHYDEMGFETDIVTCCIVLSNKYLNANYSEFERTYYFDNYNKALCSDDGGYSIFASCQDGDIMRIENFNNDRVERIEWVRVCEGDKYEIYNR